MVYADCYMFASCVHLISHFFIFSFLSFFVINCFSTRSWQLRFGTVQLPWYESSSLWCSALDKVCFYGFKAKLIIWEGERGWIVFLSHQHGVTCIGSRKETYILKRFYQALWNHFLAMFLSPFQIFNSNCKF